jgi:hypothetical protein
LHLRWQGGTCEDLAVELPPNVADRLRYPSPIVEKIRQLAASVGDAEIAAALNQQGLLSAKGKPFTASIIKWLRYKHGISAPEGRMAVLPRGFRAVPGVAWNCAYIAS